MNPLLWLIEQFRPPHDERRRIAEAMAETEMAHQREIDHARRTRAYIEIADSRMDGIVQQKRRRRNG